MSNTEAASTWLSRARQGDFAALPEPFIWDMTSEFSHLIHGYRISETLGLGPLRIWANKRISEARRCGRWTGTAIELWLCLFYERRRYRHMDEGDPEGDELDLLNQLCQQLREELQKLDANEHTVINKAILISAPPSTSLSLQ